MTEREIQAAFGDDPGYIAMCGHRMARRFTLTVWSLSLLSATVAIGLAWHDKSWGALGIALCFSPIVNGVLLLGNLISLWLCRRRNRTMPQGTLMLSAVFAPLSSLIVTEIAIFSMDLHGC